MDDNGSPVYTGESHWKFLGKVLVKMYLLPLLSAASPSHKATDECSTVVKDTEKELEAEQEHITSLWKFWDKFHNNKQKQDIS